MKEDIQHGTMVKPSVGHLGKQITRLLKKRYKAWGLNHLKGHMMKTEKRRISLASSFYILGQSP